MRLKQPTIKDVARLAGVSKTTVGRVISGEQDRVSEDTRSRVHAAIQMLGYERNSIASSLRTDQTFIVALSIPDIMNPFWPEVARGVQDTFEVQGYTVALLNSDWDATREANHLQTVRRNRFDGIVLNPIKITNNELKSLSTPAVLLGSGDDYPDFDSVGSNSAGAVYTAMRHLIELGHTRIGLIAGVSQRSHRDMRYQCYADMHYQAGLALDESLVVRAPYSRTGGADAMRQLLSLPHPPTAVLAGNDILAIGALLAAQGAGLTVPVDLSIIGIDDIYAAATTSPPLTTVAKPKYEIGVQAANLLLEKIRGVKHDVPQKLLLDGHLQIRQTTSAPA
ncbi:LacI family DNA-binding transcriptional regulator [Aggregatilinea lenta]|uniref:LacI family DNA-binding transcriptional regulator n=1 Tax=Aggregatilinea lenta TaxID=913108 RepID=UPI0013C34659|nr:LacI family DNA-binding transcriptional regulator [Aggregatilinea lenta]